jgi:hypothetical protein
MGRYMNSTYFGTFTLSLTTMNRRNPRALTAEIMLSPNRCPVAATTSVYPRTPQVVQEW